MLLVCNTIENIVILLLFVNYPFVKLILLVMYRTSTQDRVRYADNAVSELTIRQVRAIRYFITVVVRVVVLGSWGELGS